MRMARPPRGFVVYDHVTAAKRPGIVMVHEGWGSPVALDQFWQIAQIGDFNGNGTSDILLRTAAAALAADQMLNR